VLLLCLLRGLCQSWWVRLLPSRYRTLHHGTAGCSDCQYHAV